MPVDAQMTGSQLRQISCSEWKIRPFQFEKQLRQCYITDREVKGHEEFNQQRLQF